MTGYPFKEIDIQLNEKGKVDYGVYQGRIVAPYHRNPGHWTMGRYIESREWWNCGGDFTLQQIKGMVNRGTVIFR